MNLTYTIYLCIRKSVCCMYTKSMGFIQNPAAEKYVLRTYVKEILRVHIYVHSNHLS